jgi:homoserine kinase type II
MAESFEPVVEMLWEADAPAVVLAGRFGFADAGGAGRWVASTVAEVWGIPVDSCDRIVLSDHNALAWIGSGPEAYIAKWSVDPGRYARLAVLATLTGWLGNEGIPVSAPIAASDGSLQIEIAGVSMGLQRQIAGELLDVSNETHVRAAGAALAQLHVSPVDCPFVEELSPPATEVRQLDTRISVWLDSERSKNAPESATRELRRRAASRSAEPLEAQLVHGDVRSANVLIAHERVSAILDFEESRSDFTIVELAHAAVLLGTRYRDWGPVSAEVHGWLLAEYQTVRPLLDVELQWWDTLVLWFSLMFIPDGEDPTGWQAAAMELLPE